MYKTKNKIVRKYQDFYKPDDLLDPDAPLRINLTTDDFDTRGHLINPRAPCIVTDIDPHYIQDARQQKLTNKFRMKTDILRLREITRKKFMIYATQERHLEKQREHQNQDMMYNRIISFNEFTEDSLNKMESQTFKEMLQTHEELNRLRTLNINDELKVAMAEHQRVFTQVQDIYGRFLYLVKLIGYFDDTIDEGNTNNENIIQLTHPKELSELNLSSNCSAVNSEIDHLKKYMEKVVQPYLSKRKHINSNIWIMGHEKTRQKLFNYYRRLTHVALLNHIVTVLNEKFERTYAKCSMKPILIDPNFMKDRVLSLKIRAINLFNVAEKHYKKDKLNLKLNGIIPVISQHINVTFLKYNGNEQQEGDKQHQKDNKLNAERSSNGYDDVQGNTLQKVEQIQSHLLNLLQVLDDVPSALCKSIEIRIRRRINMQKRISKYALVEQNRLHNWMEHFRKHELQKPKLRERTHLTSAPAIAR